MTILQDQLTLVKFWHVMGGLYIWEYVTTLDYEWKVIRGRLPYRWTIWIYSLARLAVLMGVIFYMVSMDTTTQINCQLWVLLSATPLCLSTITALLLIVLRTIAIWNRNKFVVALAIIVLVVIIGSHVRDIVMIRSLWISPQLGCLVVKGDAHSYILTIIADITLFLIILTGLLVLRRDSGIIGLTHVVWKQGIIWMVIAVAVEIPLLVFTVVHLNGDGSSTELDSVPNLDPLQNLFVGPGNIILTIATTRMHRALVYFASGSPDTAENFPVPVSNLVFYKTKPGDSLSIALDSVEAATHMAVEQNVTGPTSNDDPSEQIPRIVGDFTFTLESAPGIPQAQTQSVTV